MTQPVSDGVDLSIRQLCGAWRVMCAGSPAPTEAAGDGIQFIFSGLPVGFFNVAVPTGSSISADRLAAHGRDAMAWAADKAVPWLFVLTHESVEPGVDATSVLGGCGLAPVMALTGMYATRVTPPEAPLPDGLQVTVPRDDAACATLVDVNSAAYAMDLEPAKVAIGTSAFWKHHVAVLGTVAGQPASTAAVMMVDGHRYVALVATDPAHQRRGYADVVMRHALDVAARAHGESATVLHATDAGRPVYARMGYTPISAHTLFMDQAFLAGH